MQRRGVCLNCLTLEAIDACGRAGQPELAVHVLERMESPDVVAITSVVNAFSRLGRAADAARWLQEAQRRGLKPNVITYNGVIHACARVAQAKQAIRWLERMEASNVEPDLCSYTGVLDAFAKTLEHLKLVVGKSEEGPARVGRTEMVQSAGREAHAGHGGLYIYVSWMSLCGRSA